MTVYILHMVTTVLIIIILKERTSSENTVLKAIALGLKILPSNKKLIDIPRGISKNFLACCGKMEIIISNSTKRDSSL